MKLKFIFPAVIALVITNLSFNTALAEQKPTNNAINTTTSVNVYAAASLTSVLQEIVVAYDAKSPEKYKINLNFASSSTLAKQIYQGAPADIYISANIKWMDYLQTNNLLKTNTRKDLLKNHLVLVAPIDYPQNTIELNAQLDFNKLLVGTRLAVGDPAHVPAGIYAQQALQYYKLWQNAEPLLAKTSNVRAALALVERKEAMLGIVYKTDALISKKVKIVAEFADASHAKIIYPMAIIKQLTSNADNANSNSKAINDNSLAISKFYNFLTSDEAIALFKKYGFEIYQ